MIYAFILFFILIVSLIFLEEYLGDYNKYAYWGLCVILILFTAFRTIGFDPDSNAYDEIFRTNGTDSELLVEYSILFISDILKIFTDDVHYLFLIYAILGITIKFYAIRQLSPWFFLPIIIYFSNYFILHDFIQIRAGVASAMLLLAIKPLSEGNKKKAIVYFLIANVFHYSSLVFYPILFFSNSLSRIWKYALIAIMPLGAILFMLRLDFLSALPIPYIQEKLEMYKTLTETGFFEEFNLKNVPLWIQYVIILYSLYFYDTILEKCPALPLLLKATAYSMFFFFAFSSVSVVAGRFQELLGIVELALFPCVCYTIRPQFYGKIAVCFIAVVKIFFILFVWKLLDFSME
jgi:hypothetical protein